MKLAFGILYHKYPKQLNYLLEQLDHENHDIYLHIDSKFEYDQTEFYELKKARLFIQPDDKRFDIKWGGFSMVRTTIQLYRTIIESKNQYDYVSLMSAQDLFIKPMNEFHDFLAQYKGKEFIAYWRLVSEMYYHWGVDFDDEFVDGTDKPSKKAALMLKYSIASPIGSANIQRRSNKKYNLLKTKKASQWTTLTLDCIKYIVKFSDDNPDFFESFQESMCPDELYIPTIIWYSEFRKDIFSTSHGMLDSIANLRRVNWNPKIKNSADMPHTYLNKKYYHDYLSKTEAFIARKFNYQIDEEIIHYVNDNLYNKHHDVDEESKVYSKMNSKNIKKISSEKFIEKYKSEIFSLNGGVNALIGETTKYNKSSKRNKKNIKLEKRIVPKYAIKKRKKKTLYTRITKSQKKNKM